MLALTPKVNINEIIFNDLTARYKYVFVKYDKRKNDIYQKSYVQTKSL